MTQGNLVFVKREKDLLWGVAGFLLGLGLLVFSEIKSVYFCLCFLVRQLGSFQAKEKT